MDNRLHQQLEFIIEIDKLKQIVRQNYVTVSGRNENDAEHSWHMAVMAVLLAEYVPGVDVLTVIKMLLIHDIVEIDAGDTYCFDQTGLLDKREREQAAAERIFSLLPSDQAADMRSLWEEFEAAQTQEARFAAALDRLQPLLLHTATSGRSWKEHHITSSHVIERNKRTKELSPVLGECVAELIQAAVQRGDLAK